MKKDKKWEVIINSIYKLQMSKERNSTMDLKDIYWGDESAENDVNLLKYFIEPRKIERMVRQSKSIIVGRKGAGKSAIRKYLSDYMKNQGKKQVVIEAAPNYSFISAVKSDDEIILKNEIFIKIYGVSICSNVRFGMWEIYAEEKKFLKVKNTQDN